MKWDVMSISLFTSFYTYLPTKTLAKWINLPCKGAVPQLSWRGLLIIQSSKLQKKEFKKEISLTVAFDFILKDLMYFWV